MSWSNKIVLRNKLSDNGGVRIVELFAAPKGAIRFTLDGSEPCEGAVYDGPITIDNDDVLLRAFAEAGGFETKPLALPLWGVNCYISGIGATMNTAQKIYELVKVLPDPAVQEVLDFIEFLENRLARTKKYGDTSQTADNRWPDIILAFEGVPDMPPFEQGRGHLLPPSEGPLHDLSPNTYTASAIQY
ncbi:MAG: DUF2281 domain-containing protein [Burkholderiaceae bacterium]|jgi:hypothetical protein|nr:DUF2281 domain-containing protein [Burkholderiaceae bacterium]